MAGKRIIEDNFLLLLFFLQLPDSIENTENDKT